MATIAVYVQQATEAEDHVLYGVVNEVPSSNNIVVTAAASHGGSIVGNYTTTASGAPFAGSIGKVIRRYTSAEWNASPARAFTSDVVAANTGTVSAVSTANSAANTQITTTGITNNWAVGDVWAIDYHSPYSFGKWSTSDKLSRGHTADETGNTAAGTTTSSLPKYTSTRPQTEFSENGEQDDDPGTTKWLLRCDTIARNYTNSAIPLPLPSPGVGDQYYNKMLDIGMRQEVINLTGTLVDRGVPTADNPRLQTLFDLVRTQHKTTINADGSDPGTNDAHPGNVRAYTRLTIGDGYEPSDYQESVGGAAGTVTQTPTYALNTNLIVRDRNYPIGGPYTQAQLGSARSAKAYRGLITSFNASIRGGMPDIWTWNMTFNVVKNEHDWTFTGS